MTSPPVVKHLVVLAHPDPNSFCASIARCWAEEAASHSQEFSILDLYREGFDPVLKKTEQPGKPGFAPAPELLQMTERVRAVDVLALVYPIWFGTPPAMMKGFFERAVGIGTTFAEGAHQGRPLRNIHLADISTSATSEPWLAEQGIRGSLRTIFDHYIADVFGARSSERLHLGNVVTGMSEASGEMKLAQVREFARRTCAQANAWRWSRNRNER